MKQLDLFGKPLPEPDIKINFSHGDYCKFDKETFSTIRKKQFQEKYLGALAEVTINRSFAFYAKITAIERKQLHEFTTAFLIKDTTRHSHKTATREQAIALLQSFYRHELTPTSVFTIITLKKLVEDKNEQKNNFKQLIEEERD